MKPLLCLAALVLWLAAVSVPGAPFRAVDGRGVTITLNSAPKRIISLIPSATELVYAIGLGRR